MGTIRRYATTLILACTLLIGEIHTFFGKNITSIVVNGKNVAMQIQPDGTLKEAYRSSWIISRYVPRTTPKNIRDLCNQINFILIFVAMFLYGKTPNFVNRVSVITFIFYSVIDTMMYFYSDKTYGYHLVYPIVAILWTILFLKFKKKIRS